MITVRIDQVEFTLDMDGHADAPKEGEFDLVCAASSTLGQLLLYTLEEYRDTHNGIIRIDESMEPGHMHIHVRAKEWSRVSIITRFSIIREGFDMLQDRYPEYIQVEEVK